MPKKPEPAGSGHKEVDSVCREPSNDPWSPQKKGGQGCFLSLLHMEDVSLLLTYCGQISHVTTSGGIADREFSP